MVWERWWFFIILVVFKFFKIIVWFLWINLVDSLCKKLVWVFFILVWILVIFKWVFFCCLLFFCLWVRLCWYFFSCFSFVFKGLGDLIFFLVFKVVKLMMLRLIFMDCLLLVNCCGLILIIKFKKYWLVLFLIIVIELGIDGKGWF